MQFAKRLMGPALLSLCALMVNSSSDEQVLLYACSCVQPGQAGVCSDRQEVSWGQWFSGNSRSTQMHFLDLLELLNRSTSGKERNARFSHQG
ncbi:hypothetical protein [Gallaecimonas sp. GXIMD4217]|uniref:hypothetical protein n=1 Tax=Gallaecimonas sp. GXIMD4217 TaxID=3131927 RepID=UPI00311AD2A4